MQASAICSHVKKHLFAESQLTFLSDKENYLRDAASHIANRKSSIYRRRNAAHAMTVNLVEREILYYCLWCAVETSRTLHSEFASPKSDHYTCKSTSSLIRLRLVILKRKRKDLLLSIGKSIFSCLQNLYERSLLVIDRRLIFPVPFSQLFGNIQALNCILKQRSGQMTQAKKEMRVAFAKMWK